MLQSYKQYNIKCKKSIEKKGISIYYFAWKQNKYLKYQEKISTHINLKPYKQLQTILCSKVELFWHQ